MLNPHPKNLTRCSPPPKKHRQHFMSEIQNAIILYFFPSYFLTLPILSTSAQYDIIKSFSSY